MPCLVPRLLMAAAAVVLLLLSTPSAASMETFIKQYQSIMESAGTGFSMFYRDAMSLPASYAWTCENVTGVRASVAYPSATWPYRMTVSTVAVTVQPVTTSASVTYELYGHSCDFYGSCSPLRIGTAPSFDVTPNRVIMVMGKMTSNNVVNFLPLAYYVVLPIAACSPAGSASVASIFSRGGVVTLWDKTEL
ncbi:hypothetical protein ABL78_8198 [Leptomonas seymouri]|uniref:Uncharacterized protein n=1 Tax=Leptomonas seymouri TaxID=5684 RepID=A0A0N1PA15_LEPSE|nr:hypothetical protein ABL78_8198 [Leptomonas seymouri]|eukprot:KPI82791.1 hypothetical protein ABL78_8198 [Leptomonas seymouri]